MLPSEDRSWSARIRDARIAARLSQKALAEMIGRKQQTVADWELGKTQPSLHDFEHVARATGTTAGALAFGHRAPDEGFPQASMAGDKPRRGRAA